MLFEIIFGTVRAIVSDDDDDDDDDLYCQYLTKAHFWKGMKWTKGNGSPVPSA